MPRRRVQRSRSDLSDVDRPDAGDNAEVVVGEPAVEPYQPHPAGVIAVQVLGRVVGTSGSVGGQIGWAVARLAGRGAWRVTRAAAVGARRRPRVAIGVIVGTAAVIGVVALVRSSRTTEVDEPADRPLRSVA